MGLLNFNKPKWHHKNPLVRLEAVATIDPRETTVLAGLIRADPDRQVRLAAIARLVDLTTLGLLVHDVAAADLPFLAARKEQLLYDLVVNAPDLDVCRDDLDQITSPELLAKLAVAGGQPAIRRAAVSGIEDQQLLAGIVEHNCGKEPALAAMAKISRAELLERLARSGASKTVRRLATTKLADLQLQKNQPDQEQILVEKLALLAAEAEQLQASTDIDLAVARCAELKQEWHKLDSGGHHPAFTPFTLICKGLEDRFQEIQQRRRQEQEKVARYERQLAAAEEICCAIERLSSSIAEEAETLKEQAASAWTSLLHDPAGKWVPSATMARRFQKGCLDFDRKRVKIRQEQVWAAVIEKNCEEIGALLGRGDLDKAGELLGATEKQLALSRFKYFSITAMGKLVAEKAAGVALAKKEGRAANLARRREICLALESLKENDDPRQVRQQLQILQQSWRQLPALEDGAEEKELAHLFQAGVAALTERLQAREHEEEWQLWANLGLKEKLAEKVALLDQQENLATVLSEIKAARDEWQKIGSSPQKKTQKVWARFHDACDRNFRRAAPYLEELKVRRAAAMARRREICAMAAELAESRDWQKTAAALKELQEEWKILPPGARRQESELYQQFRAACNRFFARRHENYQGKQAERQQHLQEKEKLCEEAEQLAAEPRVDCLQQFDKLKVRWQKTGPAPRDQQEPIRKRFQAAVDSFLNWLTEKQLDNLKHQEALCAKVTEILAEAAGDYKGKELATRLTGIQEEWQEIGPVPSEQGQDLWQRFNDQCEAFFAARRQQIEEDEQQHRRNQSTREELLAQAEDLGIRGVNKKTAATLQELQKKWHEVGPVGNNSDLDGRFKTACDALEEGRHQYFADLKKQQLANQKKKERLCLRLANVLGTSSGPESEDVAKALTLAEAMKQAMEDNFMLAGRRNEKKTVSEEIRRIEQEWKKTGPVPYEQAEPVRKRFKKLLDGYQKNNPNE